MTPAIRSLPIAGRQLRLLVSALVLALGVASAGSAIAPSPALAWTTGTFSTTSESELVALTNQSRANAGLKALKVDPKLTSLARDRSKDMVVRDYFSHQIPPDNHSVFDVMQDTGYCFHLAGENIGYNVNYPEDEATQAIHDAFMNSTGHRANILGSAWDVMGVGAYQGPAGKKMWTVLFADACGSSPTPTPKPTPKPTPRPTPRPTPKPTAAPPTAAPPTSPTTVPTATPEPAGATRTADPGPTPSTDPAATPSPAPSPTAKPDPTGGGVPGASGAATPGPASPGPGAKVPAVAAPLRVVEAAPPQGLLETIIGGVTSFFFGS